MNSMKSLINLSKWKVDEIRIQLREAEAKVAEVGEKIEKLDRQLIHEQHFLSDQETPFLGAYAAYSRGAKTYRVQLSSKYAELDREAETLRDQLREAFLELKKYEKVYDDTLIEAHQLDEKLQQEDADEKTNWKTRNWG